jgi:putative acetyltransferase
MIRKYEIQDEHAIIELWYESNLKAHPFISPTFLQEVKADFREKYLPNSETWVYEEHERVKGFLSFVEGTIIAGLFVLPDCQGQGIGTSLMNHAKSLRAQLKLYVFKENPKSIHFYQKCGFTKTEESIHQETGCEQFTMEWENSTIENDCKAERSH